MAMTQEQRIAALATATGVDVKALYALVGALSGLDTSAKASIVAALNEVVAQKGDLGALATTAKTSLVAAINELKSAVASASAINDASATSSSTYSSAQIEARLAAAKDSLLGGTPAAAYDTLKELADYVASDQTAAAAMAEAIGYRVRFDAPQTLTPAQQLQACQNMGIGNPDTDFVAAYNAAKA